MIKVRINVTSLSDGIQCSHPVQVVTGTCNIHTDSSMHCHKNYLCTIDTFKFDVCVFLLPDCSLWFSRSSSGDSRRGSKWIFWTWHSLASISCLSSYRKHTQNLAMNTIAKQQQTVQEHTSGSWWCECYLRSIVAKGNMWSSPRFHGKSHNLSFHKDEQQNKHLEESQMLDNPSICLFLLHESIMNKTSENNRQSQIIEWKKSGKTYKKKYMS